MAKVYDKLAPVENAAEDPNSATKASKDNVAPSAMSGLYRAAWRWHFYAGIFVVPVLVILAVTGGIYLFKDQLEPVFYPELMRVPLPVEGTTTRPLSEQVSAVQEAFPNNEMGAAPLE